jgi:predicted O-linked N-acetylglucosamine transferase (SPINDLY family)
MNVTDQNDENVFQESNTMDQKIRLAYMSGDFNSHPLAYLTVELFELHDRDKFEVHAISVGRDDGSEIRGRLTKAFDYWHEVGGMIDRDIIDLIRNLDIDILVDLIGHTANTRPGILAEKPAPIQANYLGFPGTTGFRAIDYNIVDQFLVPIGQDKFFTEKLIRLPHSYMIHDSQQKVSEYTPTREECSLPDKGFVFCCFNNMYKITPEIFEVWMRLLRAVPGSVLWFFEGNHWVKENLRREAQLRQVDGDRLVFAPFKPNADHLARHRLADLFLDTPVYNAHTTAMEALWVGLPVLTCAGQSFAARVAGSLLMAAGLSKLITFDLAEYEALALRLANEREQLAGYAEHLVLNREKLPLFDSQRFTRDIETAYTWMHHHQLAGQNPEAFSV